MNHVYIIPSYHHRHDFAHIIISSSPYILSYNHIASRNAGSIYFIIALHIFIASLHHQQHIASHHNHLTLHHIINTIHSIIAIHCIIASSTTYCITSSATYIPLSYHHCIINTIQAAKREAAEKLGMLRTKEMRERDRLQGLRKYRYSLIRVKFPDNIILQVCSAHARVCVC